MKKIIALMTLALCLFSCSNDNGNLDDEDNLGSVYSKELKEILSILGNHTWEYSEYTSTIETLKFKTYNQALEIQNEETGVPSPFYGEINLKRLTYWDGGVERFESDYYYTIEPDNHRMKIYKKLPDKQVYSFSDWDLYGYIIVDKKTIKFSNHAHSYVNFRRKD